eukprot:Rhum_TRINITY_DN10871_c0_g1::Rhum_TRINITY_DN10871_c0_g1_i1::g.40800::m.40800
MRCRLFLVVATAAFAQCDVGPTVRPPADGQPRVAGVWMKARAALPVPSVRAAGRGGATRGRSVGAPRDASGALLQLEGAGRQSIAAGSRQKAAPPVADGAATSTGNWSTYGSVRNVSMLDDFVPEGNWTWSNDGRVARRRAATRVPCGAPTNASSLPVQWGFTLYFAEGRFAMLMKATRDALVGAIGTRDAVAAVGASVGTEPPTVHFASGVSVTAVAVLGTVIGLVLLGVAVFFARRALARKEGSDVACSVTKGRLVCPVDAGCCLNV